MANFTVTLTRDENGLPLRKPMVLESNSATSLCEVFERRRKPVQDDFNHTMGYAEWRHLDWRRRQENQNIIKGKKKRRRRRKRRQKNNDSPNE